MSDRVRELDGSVSRYDDVPVAGDTVGRLLTDLFSTHWADVTFGAGAGLYALGLTTVLGAIMIALTAIVLRPKTLAKP